MWIHRIRSVLEFAMVLALPRSFSRLPPLGPSLFLDSRDVAPVAPCPLVARRLFGYGPAFSSVFVVLYPHRFVLGKFHEFSLVCEKVREAPEICQMCRRISAEGESGRLPPSVCSKTRDRSRGSKHSLSLPCARPPTFGRVQGSFGAILSLYIGLSRSALRSSPVWEDLGVCPVLTPNLGERREVLGQSSRCEDSSD